MRLVGAYAPFRDGRFFQKIGVVTFPLVHIASERRYLERGFILPVGAGTDVVISSQLEPGHLYGRLSGVAIVFSVGGRLYSAKYGFSALGCTAKLSQDACTQDLKAISN